MSTRSVARFRLRTWIRSSWLELTLSLLLAAVEAAAIAPWLRLASQDGQHSLSGVGVFVVGLLLFWTTRAFLAAGWDEAAARALDVVVWVALMLAWYAVASGVWFRAPFALVDDLISGRRLAVALVVAGVVVWWRANQLGPNPDTFSVEHVRRTTLRAMLMIGLAAIVGVTVSAPASDTLKHSAAAALPVAFICGLVAAAAAQLRAAQHRQLSQSRQKSARWLAVALTVSLGMFALALVLATLVIRDTWDIVGGPLGTAADALGTVAFWVLIAIAYAFFLIIYPIIWLVRLVAHGGNTSSTVETSPGIPSPTDLQQGAENSLPLAVRVALEIGVIVVLVLVALWLVLHGLRRYRLLQRQIEPDEERESLWSRELVAAQLRSLRPRRRRPAHRQATTLDFSQPPQDVRSAYRYLLVLGQQHEQPREPAETPIDYLADLTERWPEVGAPLDDLTTRYLHVRYGERSTGDDPSMARHDWETIYQHVASDNHAGQPGADHQRGR